MKPIHNTWRELINDCIQIALLAGTVGIALKFITFFDKWVYFPSFPNICDSTFLIIAATYLFWKANKSKQQENITATAHFNASLNTAQANPDKR